MRLFDESSSWRRLIRDETLAEWPDDILLVDWASLSSVDHPIDRCIVVADKLESKIAVHAAKEMGVRHVVQVSNPTLNQSVRIAAQMIMRPDAFADNPSTTLLLGSKGAMQSMAFPFRASKEKSEVLEQCRGFLSSSLGLRSQLIITALLIADELFTNAAFSAPIDKATGKQKYAHLARTTSVELDPGASAQLIVGMNEQTFLVGCEDSYGSLTLERALGRISACYEKGAGQAINLNQGGSGIGCYLMMEHSSSFVISLLPGRKTVMAVLIPYTLPEKLRAAIPKNIHVGVTP